MCWGQCVTVSSDKRPKGRKEVSSGISGAAGGDHSLDDLSVSKSCWLLLKFTSGLPSIKYHCLHLSIRAREVLGYTDHLLLGL